MSSVYPLNTKQRHSSAYSIDDVTMALNSNSGQAPHMFHFHMFSNQWYLFAVFQCCYVVLYTWHGLHMRRYLQLLYVVINVSICRVFVFVWVTRYTVCMDVI